MGGSGAKCQQEVTTYIPAIWVLVASVLYASMGALIKHVSSEIPLSWILLFRNLPTVIVLFLFARVRKRSVVPPNRRLYTARCTIGVAGMILSFYAMGRLPLAMATTLEYTAPLFLLTWYVVSGGTRVTVTEVAATLVGFGGILLILRPTMQSNQVAPFLAALAAGACAAAAYRLVWRLGQTNEPGWRIVLWYSIAGIAVALVSLPFATPSAFSADVLSALVAIGLLGMVGQLAVTQAFKSGSTSLLSTLQYSTILFAAVYGAIVWNDAVDPETVGGLFLIVSSSGLVAYVMRLKERTLSEKC